MTPDLQEEFYKLRSEAMESLHNVPASGSYRLVFSFWIFPSFASAKAFTLYVPQRAVSNHKPLISVLVWRSDLDLETFESPVSRLKHPKNLKPTIESDTLWLTLDEAREIEESISSTPIPFFLKPPTWAGCDGIAYEFRYDHGSFGGSLRWWENFPEEWRSFTTELVRLVERLEKRLLEMKQAEVPR